jgi:hypothetical protein
VVTFYPASGNRNSASGAINNTDVYGFYWSSAVSSANASYLRFFNTDVSPAYFSARGNSFPVRCVQHLLLLLNQYFMEG